MSIYCKLHVSIDSMLYSVLSKICFILIMRKILEDSIFYLYSIFKKSNHMETKERRFMIVLFSPTAFIKHLYLNTPLPKCQTDKTTVCKY